MRRVSKQHKCTISLSPWPHCLRIGGVQKNRNTTDRIENLTQLDHTSQEKYSVLFGQSLRTIYILPRSQYETCEDAAQGAPHPGDWHQHPMLTRYRFRRRFCKAQGSAVAKTNKVRCHWSLAQELVHTAHGTTAPGLLVCCCASGHVASTVTDTYLVSLDLVAPISHT